MHFGGISLGRGARYLIIFAALGLQFLTTTTQQTVYAQDSSVQATVDNGDVHPALSLTLSSPVTVTNMPFELSGSVQDITQIQVYVDNIFSVTVPLSVGATSFSTSLIVSAGTHSVKLVGVSPFADRSPTASIAVTYTPTQIPDLLQDKAMASGVDSDPSDNTSGVVISHDGTATTKYVTPMEKTALPNWLYNGLVAIDIAQSGDSDKQIAATAQRAAVTATGLFLLVFARPVLYGLYLIRFRWFGLKACQLVGHSPRPPLMRFRLIGILLVFSVLSFS